jgi:hypothetical protein
MALPVTLSNLLPFVLFLWNVRHVGKKKQCMNRESCLSNKNCLSLFSYDELKTVAL